LEPAQIAIDANWYLDKRLSLPLQVHFSVKEKDIELKFALESSSRLSNERRNDGKIFSGDGIPIVHMF
jgi:hypothetical protein